MKLDDEIDALYQLNPEDFTAARNALAKTLKKDDAALVRGLAKPTSPAWAVNQLYWRERAIFDRVRDSGTRLLAAQVAALQGRAADVRAATEAHRAAVADAVRRTTVIAASHKIGADTDAIARTLEALSLSPGDVTPGRLARPLQPAGFAALAGITPALHVTRPAESPAPAAPHAVRVVKRPAAEPRAEREAEKRRAEEAKRQAAEAKREAAEARAAERRTAAERRALEHAVERAREREARARHALAEAEKERAEAEMKLRAFS